MVASRNQAIAELARRHPTSYRCATFQYYKPAWFHWLIGDILKQVADGKHKKVIITLPPQNGKSELCSIGFPSWYLSQGERRKIIASSYAASLARGFGKKARNLIYEPEQELIFPGVKFSRTVGQAANDWGLSNGAEYFSCGVEGGATGRGANVFLIDDPYKNRKMADSAVYRETVKDFYSEVVKTRLTPDGAIIIIMTRWHFDDLVGWRLREFPEEDWLVLRLPALMDTEPSQFDKRKPDEALWPGYFTKEWLEEQRAEIGPRSFNCLYQGTPKIDDGIYFDLNWFPDYNYEPIPDNPDMPAFKRIVVSWDTAFEAKQQNDYSVGCVIGETETSRDLLEVKRGRWTFPRLKKEVIALNDRWQPSINIIEKKASGHDIINTLKKETNISVLAINPKNSKESRAAAVSGQCEAGRVRLPKRAAWLSKFMMEIEEFPNGPYDDQVDTFTQVLRYCARSDGGVI